MNILKLTVKEVRWYSYTKPNWWLVNQSPN